MNDNTAAWRGDFGDAYHARQANIVPANIAFFSRALRRAGGVTNILEFGAGTGMNIEALRRLYPDAHLQAVEVNPKAAETIGYADSVFCTSILKFQPARETPADLVFTKGVLIHIPPEELLLTYQKLYEATQRYILIAEYYSPRLEEVPYRGESDKLWRGDYAGAMLKLYPDLALIDYGFAYHRDPVAPQDDISWFLLSKQPC